MPKEIKPIQRESAPGKRRERQECKTARYTGHLHTFRALKRALQEHVMEPLSEKIIAGEVQPGQKVSVDWKGGKFGLGTGKEN
jgi:ATP-dependent Clp protease ATP-binding subunit ClpA